MVHGGFKLLGRAFGEIHPISSYLFFFFEWIGLKAPEIFWNGNGLAMETYRVEELSCF